MCGKRHDEDCVQEPAQPPPLPTSPPPPLSEIEGAARPLDLILRGPHLDTTQRQPIFRQPTFERIDSPSPTELDVSEEEIVVFRNEAVRSAGDVVRLTVEAHVEPEPTKKRQRLVGQSAALTGVCIIILLIQGF